MALCSTLVVLPPANSILMALCSTLVLLPPANSILMIGVGIARPPMYSDGTVFDFGGPPAR